eukprot:TRINITY_DN3847_c0_g1_i4.p1 TRINITY_DN3847_c0_g1~~TRINITY_DN3847_c0_g1_i4.p1  ORF type:complete len:105 (+),score=11.18 TRINITY_DN3847_c0_g1_i4:66-380(+)
MEDFILRIKFPTTYPVIYKTLKVNSHLSVKQAVKFIATCANVQNLLLGTEGLYISDEDRWLDDDKPLSVYESIQDVVRYCLNTLNLNSKKAHDPKKAKRAKNNK